MKKNFFKTIVIVFVTIFSVIVFNSCNNSNNNKENGYTVNFDLKNAAGKKFIIGRLTAQKIVDSDTVEIDKDGKAIINGKTPFRELFMFQSDDKSVFGYLVIDTIDNITITGDFNNFNETYKVEGSEESELVRQVIYHNSQSNKKMRAISDKINNETDPVKKDSLIAAGTQILSQTIEEERKYAIDFINAHPGSLAAFLVINLGVLDQPTFNINQDHSLFKYYKKIEEGMKKDNPNSEFTKLMTANNLKMKEYIDSQKQNNILAVGSEAPDFEAMGIDEKMHKLSDFRGKYVLLDFWAAWCRPCRAENPNVVENYKKFKDKNFTVLQVSLDGSRENWINAIKKDGLEEWTHVSDLKEWQSEYARLYNVRSIPSNFLIDPEGKIIAKNLRGVQLGAKLSELLD